MPARRLPMRKSRKIMELLLTKGLGVRGAARSLLEILEDRHELRSTLVTSQLPVKKWYDALRHPTLADAILDRLVHNAYRIEMKGESMRKKRARRQSISS